VVITLIGQEYKSTERCQDYKTGTETTYSGREQPIDIGKSNNNFKDRKPKCFNCNKYGYITKKCWNKKKEKEISSATKKDTLQRTVKENSQ